MRSEPEPASSARRDPQGDEAFFGREQPVQGCGASALHHLRAMWRGTLRVGVMALKTWRKRIAGGEP